MTYAQKDKKGFRWLTPTALAFTVIVFGSRYMFFPLAVVYKTVERLGRYDSLLRRPLDLVYVGLYPINLLFTRLPVYLTLSFVAVLLGVGTLALARPAKRERVLVLLGLGAVLAMPLVYTYEPAVAARLDGGRVTVPTQPGPIAGVVKATQAGDEVRRCDYNLLGWGEQDELYGEESCGTQHRFWVYRPTSDRGLQTVSNVPTNLATEEVSREQLTALGVRSTVPHDERLRIVVREPGLRAREDGRVAFVARHVYGPEDVVVIEQ